MVSVLLVYHASLFKIPTPRPPLSKILDSLLISNVNMHVNISHVNVLRKMTHGSMPFEYSVGKFYRELDKVTMLHRVNLGKNPLQPAGLVIQIMLA